MKKTILLTLPVTICLFVISYSSSAQGDAKKTPESTEIWEPQPRIITPGEKPMDAPSDATVLFDGKNLDQWTGEDGAAADNRTLKGVFLGLFRWDWILSDALHAGTEPLVAVINNTCGEATYSYMVTGMDAEFMDVGDVHDARFSDREVVTPIKHIQGVTAEGEACQFFLHTYPSVEFRESYASDQPIIFTVIVAIL